MRPVDGFRPETQVAVEAVAAAVQMTHRRKGADDVHVKAPRDLTTATDLAVENAIRTALQSAVGAAVVGEEGGAAGGNGASFWLVDPICGTRNFASGIPLYCINVALVEDGRVTLAVIGDPTSDEIYVAELGTGAWALERSRRRRLTASDASQTIVIEDSHADPDPNRRDRAADSVARAIRAFRWDIRALSTTLALPYVASGRVAAYVLFWTSAIHAAAGGLLAAEAGASVSDVDGCPWTIHSDSIVASATPELHDDLLALVGSESTIRQDPNRVHTGRTDKEDR
jgi:myo-inositol-1(or 4)-monophosphatase